MNPKSLRRPAVCTATAAAWILACWPTVTPILALGAGSHHFEPVLSTTVGERYDSNVMLQNSGAQARRQSWVSSVLPVVGARVEETAGETPCSVDLQYAPDFTLFHQLSRESYLRHIGLFDLAVQHEGFSANALFKAQYTDGTTEPPTWGTEAAGDQVPAIGAPEVRNRRRNAQWTTKVVGRQELGRGFVRGVFDARIWDFMLEDTFVQGLLIQNYYDRSDINGGFDVGFKVHPKLEPYVGYRLGHQDQEFRAVPPYAPTAPSYSYANQYQRFFVGASITPSSRVILSGEIGPSLHFFDRSTIQPQDAGHAERDYLYFLVNGTFQLASNTTLKVTGNQHLLPASAGNAVFQWPSAAGTLGHRFSSQWRGQFRFAYTEYDFDGGITRRDQVYVAEATVRYSVNRHMDIEAFDAYEWGANVLDIPNGSKRDYDRNLVGVRLRASY